MEDLSLADERVVYELNVDDDNFGFASSIQSALVNAKTELDDLEDDLGESIETVRSLTPECDKLDYALAASSGAICGVIDIFLVGKPGESPIGDLSDKWFANRTKDFAKLCKWDDKNDGSLSSAIKYLEEKFGIPYDQTGTGGAAAMVFDLTPKNHHFKSLAHNPSLVGLFFSILDQFLNESHFVTGGDLINLEDADGRFVLKGKSIPSKLFCGIVNWFGHLISDMSGSSGSKGRGMGIPSPLWTWSNDIIAIKRKLGIPASDFDKSVNDLALKIYKEGYDSRFQAAQAIPVFINEMLVRVMYSVRRLIKYFRETEKGQRSFKALWKSCEPFSNATVKRMLTVAHGTFCLVDIGDATIRGFTSGGGTFNVAEFFMRLNIVGLGRFSISLYGEVRRASKSVDAKIELRYLERKRTILLDYMEGLKVLSESYDDRRLLTFVDDLQKSDMYQIGFLKTVELAKMRDVEEGKILKTKEDIDVYFRGGEENV